MDGGQTLFLGLNACLIYPRWQKGDGMCKFTFASARLNEANKCPWQIPGRDYVSSCLLKNERDDNAKIEDVNRKFKRRRNNETSYGEE